MANRIIFLGAGASKADGAPLQAELFKAYVNSLSCSFNLDYHNRYHKTKRNVFAYFADFFGIDITVLFRCGHTSQAFDIICTLFQTSGLTLPQEFYSGIKTDLDKHKFVGEFLTDFQEILDELHI